MRKGERPQVGRLTTHVLDTAHGRPGAGVSVRLFALADGRDLVAEAVTNADGRTNKPLLDENDFRPGPYELEFAIGAYFDAIGVAAGEPPFLDDVVVRVQLCDNQHYHVPLLVTPWSYSTYRGS